MTCGQHLLLSILLSRILQLDDRRGNIHIGSIRCENARLKRPVSVWDRMREWLRWSDPQRGWFFKLMVGPARTILCLRVCEGSGGIVEARSGVCGRVARASIESWTGQLQKWLERGVRRGSRPFRRRSSVGHSNMSYGSCKDVWRIQVDDVVASLREVQDK